MPTEPEHDAVQLRRHARMFKLLLKCLPSAYSSMDAHRLTALFFLLSGLDVIQELEGAIDDETRRRLVDGIYHMQITRDSGAPPERWGFRGAFSAAVPVSDSRPVDAPTSFCDFDSPHIAQTYSALCCLVILGDDLSRVDRAAVLRGVGLAQQPDGSFTGYGDRTEADMRFLFCAAAICFMLDDWSFVDVDAMTDFVVRTQTYEGGFGQVPALESHGGSTYCAVAALALMHRLHDGKTLTPQHKHRLVHWALRRQGAGFHGRTNKPDDTCYAFWIGASLAMLNCQNLVNTSELRKFLFSCEDTSMGGFCKFPDSETSDLLHTYFGLVALSIFNEPSLLPIYPQLNISMRAFEHLMRVQSTWRSSSPPAKR